MTINTERRMAIRAARRERDLALGECAACLRILLSRTRTDTAARNDAKAALARLAAARNALHTTRGKR